MLVYCTPLLRTAASKTVDCCQSKIQPLSKDCVWQLSWGSKCLWYPVKIEGRVAWSEVSFKTVLQISYPAGSRVNRLPICRSSLPWGGRGALYNHHLNQATGRYIYAGRAASASFHPETHEADFFFFYTFLKVLCNKVWYELAQATLYSRGVLQFKSAEACLHIISIVLTKARASCSSEKDIYGNGYLVLGPFANPMPSFMVHQRVKVMGLTRTWPPLLLCRSRKLFLWHIQWGGPTTCREHHRVLESDQL